MAKYGVENFIFEVISTCRTQEDTDETESILIQQYNSQDKQFGYNLKSGASYGGHSEETKEKQRQATIKQIVDKGHPAAGRIVSQETRDLLRKIRLDNPVEYTEEVRKNMSEAHKGIKQPEELIRKRVESIQKTLEKKRQKLIEAGQLKCLAPGCEISGKAAYKIINGIRYCNKHGLRMLRYNRLDTLSS
jgi:group I intron endonuclease